MTIRPRRSVLYMPASNARALEKARSLDADTVIFDLEDAVAPEAKELARRQAVEAVSSGGYGRREVVIRINGINTPWGADDLAAVAGSGADAVLVPKVSTVQDLAWVQKRVDANGKIAIWAMMETPGAILNAAALAAARSDIAPAFAVMVLGTNDLAKDTRVALKNGREAFIPWMMLILAAARSAGLDLLDGVYNNFDDEEGFRAECAQGRDLGMDGKTLIHPKQIADANSIFMPDASEIAWAQKVTSVFDEPANAELAVVRIDGKMVERLHAEMAQRVLSLAAAVAG